MKPSRVIVRACVVLEGRNMTASEIGSELWPRDLGGSGAVRPARMLLGRMRKLGLVRTTQDPGSPRWELTLDGHGIAELAARRGKAAP